MIFKHLSVRRAENTTCVCRDSSFLGMSTFRALVARERPIPCRFNILRGVAASAKPRSTPPDVQAHIHIANCFLRQLGIELALDTNLTVKHGAVVSAIPGIFTVNVANGVTRGLIC